MDEQITREITDKKETAAGTAGKIQMSPSEHRHRKILMEIGKVMEQNRLNYEEAIRYLKLAASEIELKALHAPFTLNHNESIPRSS